MGRCVKAVLWKVDGCVQDEGRESFKALMGLLDELIERVERKGEKVIYDVSECNVIIECVVEGINKVFEV